MASGKDWLLGARPQTLPVAFATALAGTAVPVWAGSAQWLHAALALITVVGVQMGANYANDYFDGIRGTDDHRVGPRRLVASGAATPGQVRAAAVISLGVATLAGIAVSLLTTPWLLLVGAACLLAAWTYTGGPRPYAYHGLGELMVFLFFGPVGVIGTAYVQLEDRLLEHWVPVTAAGIGVGILTSAVMISNNIRDIPTDRESGKHTLPVAIGDRASRYLHLAMLVVALLCLLVIGATTSWWALVGLVFLALAVPAVRSMLSGVTGTALVPVLARTSLSELLWAAGLFAGLVVAAA